jgi:hypothetical protein
MEEKVITITEDNYTEYIPLDPIAFSMAEGGAMGSPGEVIIIDKNSDIYNFWLQDVEHETAKRIIPVLFKCHFAGWGMFWQNRPAEGWHYFNLGAGNHLLIKDSLYNDFYPEVQGYMDRPALLYQRWIKLVLAIMRLKE